MCSLTLCISIFTLNVAYANPISQESSKKNEIISKLKLLSNTGGNNLDIQKAIQIIENFTDIESDNYIADFDEETGIVTHTNFDENGTIIEQYSTNFYDNLDNILNIQINQTEILNEMTNNQLETYSNLDVLDGSIDIESNVYSYYSKVHERRMSLLDDTFYIAATLNTPKVDFIQLVDSKGNASFGYYDDYKLAPWSVTSFFRDADKTIDYGNEIVGYLGGAVAATFITWLGGTATLEKVQAFLDKYGISLVVPVGTLLMTTKNYFVAKKASDDKHNLATQGALYRGTSDGVQFTDQCKSKWIPGLVEEQLRKSPRNIVIEQVNGGAPSNYPTYTPPNISTGGTPLYKGWANGKQFTDKCTTKWIPGLVEEQLNKGVSKIQLVRVQ